MSGRAAPDSYNTIDDGESSLKKGFTVAGIVFLFLLVLVVLRFGCNLLIDLCVLRDFRSLRRTLTKLRQRMPKWITNINNADPHMDDDDEPISTIPPGTTTNHNNHGDEEASPSSSALNHQNTMDKLLEGLTQPQKKQLLASLLKMKSKRRIKGDGHEDPDQMCSSAQADAEASSSDSHSPVGSRTRTTMCSICIQTVGDADADTAVILQACNHVFHKDCLAEWLSHGQQHCPYCRTDVIYSPDMMDEAYRLRGNISKSF